MDENDLLAFGRSLPGVVVMTADEGSGAPASAWGDSFFYYDPDDDEANRRMPFATVVVTDYPGFDEASDLDRPGVFRLNVAVGTDTYRELLCHAPAEHPAHADAFQVAELDRILPHPIYASQGWISILNPGERTSDDALKLIGAARDLAQRRHDRRSSV